MEGHRSPLGPVPRRPVLAGDQATARLIQLGFPDPFDLRSAVEEGAASARSTTGMHPRAYMGMKMWAETTANLGYRLQPAGWVRETLLGAELVTHRPLGRALVVTAGDGATGSDGYVPQVRYERGEVIGRLVNGDFDTLWDAAKGRPEWEVWFLLHRVTRSQPAVLCELSKPARMGRGGLVTDWFERIIVPDFEDRPPCGRRRDEETPAAPVIDVDVRRRSG